MRPQLTLSVHRSIFGCQLAHVANAIFVERGSLFCDPADFSRYKLKICCRAGKDGNRVDKEIEEDDMKVNKGVAYTSEGILRTLFQN